MSELIFKNARILIGGVDLSGVHNECNLTAKADILDRTVFTSSARRRTAGLEDVEFTAGGFFDSGTTKAADPKHFAAVGSTGNVLTVLPEGTGLGLRSYFVDKMSYEYSPGGAVGEMLGFNIACYGDGRIVGGKLFQAGSLSSAVTPTVQNIGYKGPSQSWYANAQVTSFSSAGAKMEIKYQIATSSAFGAGVADVIKLSTFSSTAGAYRAETGSTSAGSTAATWGRFVLTPGTTLDSITAYLSAGIR